MKKNLYLNDVNVGDYGIFINSDTYLNAPQIDYNDYKVPARNGSVIQYNKRFENVVRKFECYIPDTQNVQTALDSLKKLIYSNVGYLKISSDYEPDFYMYGYMAQDIEIKPFNKELTATFELYFSCMPQKYIASPVETELVSWGYSKSGYYTISNINYDAQLQRIFDNVNPVMMPKTELYYKGAKDLAYGASVSSVTVSYTGDDVYMALAIITTPNSNEFDSYEVVKYLGFDKISNLTGISIDAQYWTSDYSLMVVIPFTNESVSCTETRTIVTSGGTNTPTWDYSIVADNTSITELTNSAALGSMNKLTITIGFDRYAAQTSNQYIFFVINGTVVRVDLVGMYNDGILQTLYQNYSYPNPQGSMFVRLADLVLDLYANTLTVTSGDNVIDLTRYIYYVGNIDVFNADTITVFSMHNTNANTWVTYVGAKLESVWWKV